MPLGGDAREMLREAIDVVHAGTAPLIDRLTWITHGGDRVTFTKDRLQKHPLRRRGVLVFIKQHEGESSTHLITHIRGRADNGETEAHLIGKIHRLLGELGLAEFGH